MKARIIAMGSYLPEKVLSNLDLEKMVDTSDEWILSRTGIKERRIAAFHEAASDMGVEAARKALERTAMDPKEIDLIVVATMTPDYLTPSTAAIIQARLGAPQAAAFDVQAACSGFLYGLSVAKAYVESGMYKKVLVVASEKMSAFIDYQDRNTCVLFGDGAAAAVVTSEGEGFHVDAIILGADGVQADLIGVPGGGSRKPATATSFDERNHYVKMTGKEVFKHAVRRMTAAANDCLNRADLKIGNIAWLVPHQANERIMDALVKNFEISPAKVIKTLHKYGNTSGSSVAISLDELIQSTPIKFGEHLLLVAFGAGLTWGATILTKKKE
jgi:3-oxoacyl-[acyl-carrier-protein] synthase-3